MLVVPLPVFADCAMDFKDRLRQATERGHQQRQAEQARQQAAVGTEEEYKRRHAAARRTLTDHVETCLEQLAENFPGFRYQNVVDERGWGGAVTRDDLQLTGGKRANLYSRLQILITPYNEFRVLDMVAKGAVRNKENFSRNHYSELDNVDLDEFQTLIEKWVLDYAQRYAT